jgi:hypothetical protein
MLATPDTTLGEGLDLDLATVAGCPGLGLWSKVPNPCQVRESWHLHGG